MRVIAADKIPTDFIAAEGGQIVIPLQHLGVDLVPVEHILIDNNPETA